jgi:hypothetical protein
MAGLAAVTEAAAARLPWTRPVGRAAGLVAGMLGPAVASYTAVLIADTATPTWHAARRDLPLVFVGSASAAAGGMGLLTAPVAEAAPARRMAIAGAALDLAAARTMEQGMGVTAEPLHQGRAGALLRAAKALTATGAVLAAVGRRRRDLSALAGLSLLAGSVCTRFGLFEAGQQSARDPRYTVVPQRERLDRGRPGHASA